MCAYNIEMSNTATFKKGNRAYMTNTDGEPTIPVKVTAVKKRSLNNTLRGRYHKYNVKIIGTKKQLQNVPESSLQHRVMANWERHLWNHQGGSRKTYTKKRRTTRRVKK